MSWQTRGTGAYDFRWGTDRIRVVVTGQLPRETHNAPLHLFSASTELVGFGSGVYRPRSPETSAVLGQLFERFAGEGLVMSYTMADFTRDYIKEHLPKLSETERREILESLPPEERLADLSEEQIRQYLERRSARSSSPRKPKRKK